MHEGVAAGQEARHVLRLAHIVEEGHIVLRLALGPGGDEQQMIVLAQQVHGLQQHVHILLPRRTAGEDEELGAGREAELLAQAVRVGAAGMEQGGVDAERLHEHIGHPGEVEALGDVT